MLAVHAGSICCSLETDTAPVTPQLMSYYVTFYDSLHYSIYLSVYVGPKQHNLMSLQTSFNIYKRDSMVTASPSRPDKWDSFPFTDGADQEYSMCATRARLEVILLPLITSPYMKGLRRIDTSFARWFWPLFVLVAI